MESINKKVLNNLDFDRNEVGVHVSRKMRELLAIAMLLFVRKSLGPVL